MSSSVGDNKSALVVAFLSVADGIGRTSTVANLGWVLASADHRVLILDLGSEPPAVADYLEPFRVNEMELTDDARRSLGKFFQTSAGLAPSNVLEHQAPGSVGRLDVYAATLPVGGTGGHEPTWDSGALSEMRSWLVDPRYDYVLIDAPTGSNAATLRMIGTGADVAAICFRPRPTEIVDAARLADELVNATPLRIDVVPVATMFDQRAGVQGDRSLAAIRRQFSVLHNHPATGPADIAVIRIPYLAYEAFQHLLTVIAEDSSDPDGLLSQYRRLANAVTRGEITDLRPAAPMARARYRRAYRLDEAGEADSILVAYTPADRVWADWVRAVLRRAGVRTVLNRLDGDRAIEPGLPELVVICSRTLAATVSADQLRRLVEPYVDHPVSHSAVFAVVDENVVELPDVQPVRLGIPQVEAEARLLTRFGLIRTTTDERIDVPTRFPALEPLVFEVSPRQPSFVGRDDDLERLRDLILDSGDDHAMVTITGGAGVGKSELAKEYAYRFAGDYDVVWWLSAHDKQSMLLGLNELMERLQAQELLDVRFNGQQPTSVLAGLAASPRISRWLLVLDNVEDLGMVDELLGGNPAGHVLITTMAASRAGIELANLPVEDGMSLLRERIPELSLASARAVATATNGLPLALQLAGSWLVETIEEERSAGASSADAALWTVRAFLEQIDSEADRDAVVRVMRLLLRSLRTTRHGRLAVLLGQFCSFLSAQGVALHLVHSPALLSQLVRAGGGDARALAMDSAEIDVVLWTGGRYGLFQVYWGTEQLLRMHRVVRDIVRDEMAVAQRADCQTALLAALAAYAPNEVEEDDGTRAQRFAELQKHVMPSGALGSGDGQVRRWLVNQLRFLYTDAGYGSGRGSTELAHHLLADWRRRFGADDPLLARLAVELANIERRAGRPAVALGLDEGALVVQRRTLGPGHPRTLKSARGMAADLRGVGRFTEALAEDESIWRNVERSFGPDHPDTRRATNNLAVSLSLSGEPAAALALEKDNFERRQRLLGSHAVETWQSLMRIGVYQRELGQYVESTQSLRQVLLRLNSLRTPPPPEVSLAADWHLSITERLRGDVRSAKDRSSRTLSRLRQALGANHPLTLVCTLSTAMDYRAVGEHALATQAAQDVRDGLREHLLLAIDHPFVALARICLGLSLCAGNEADAALPEVTEGLAALRVALHEVHPWTLAARVAQARVIAAGGDVARAAELVRDVFETSAKFLGGRHPNTRIAAENLTVASRPDAEFDEGWRDIDVDIPQI
jgi:cellulose biosynthesis protein BcsQ